MGCAFQKPPTADADYRKRVESLGDIMGMDEFPGKSPRVTPFKSIESVEYSFKTNETYVAMSKPKADKRLKTVAKSETTDSIDISAVPSIPQKSKLAGTKTDESIPEPPVIVERNGAGPRVFNDNLAADSIPPLITSSSSSRRWDQEIGSPVATPGFRNRTKSTPNDNGGAPPSVHLDQSPSLQSSQSPEDYSHFNEQTQKWLATFHKVTCEASYKNLVLRRHEFKQNLQRAPKDIQCVLQRAKDFFEVARISLESSVLEDDMEYEHSWRELARLRNDIKRWYKQLEQRKKEGENTISMRKRMRKRVDDSFFEARWRHGSVSRMSRKRTDTILSRIRADTGFSSSATNRNRNVSFAPHVTLGKLTEEPTPRFVSGTSTVEENNSFDPAFSSFEGLTTDHQNRAMANMWKEESPDQDSKSLPKNDNRKSNADVILPPVVNTASLPQNEKNGNAPTRTPHNLHPHTFSNTFVAKVSDASTIQSHEEYLDAFDVHTMDLPDEMDGLRLRKDTELSYLSNYNVSICAASPVNMNNMIRRIFAEQKRSPKKALRMAKNLFTRARYALRELEDDVEYDMAWRILAELRRAVKIWEKRKIDDPPTFSKKRTKIAAPGHRHKKSNLSCYSVHNFSELPKFHMGRSKSQLMNMTNISELNIELQGSNVRGGMSFESFGGEDIPKVMPSMSRDSLGSTGTRDSGVALPNHANNNSLATPLQRQNIHQHFRLTHTAESKIHRV